MRLRARAARIAIAPWGTAVSLDAPRVRVGLAHAAAVGLSAFLLAVHEADGVAADRGLVALTIVVGLAVLRVASVGRRLALSTLVLDAAGTVAILAGTGAPGSPFYLFALAGVWWSAHVPRPRSGMVYALAFLVAYGLLIVPGAMRELRAPEALEDVAALLVVALLADWFVRVDRRAIQLNDALGSLRFGAEEVAIRDGLSRALGVTSLPVDVVLAAAQVGLTAIQAELMAYLVLGLTNQEIADATGVSEATVRYRLTRLYRALGVRSRREAARRARVLGLAADVARDGLPIR